MRVAGFGFRRSASLASLESALDQLHQRYGPVDRLAAVRPMLPLVQELGDKHGIAVLGVAEGELPQVVTLTRSEHSLQARGTGSVAEAVALLAAGPGATLIGPRLISADRLATAALARVPLKGDGA